MHNHVYLTSVECYVVTQTLVATQPLTLTQHPSPNPIAIMSSLYQLPFAPVWSDELE